MMAEASAPPSTIVDATDPRLEPYRNVRERDLVGRQGGFVAEGEVVLRTALRAGLHRLESVLLAEHRWPALADAFGDGPRPAIYLAPQAVMDSVVGFPIHGGVLGIGRRRPDPGPEGLLAKLPTRSVILGLVGLGNHDNMGGVFRNAAAFGLGAVLLDASCCDPLYRKAIRVSVGATLTVPFARVAHTGEMIAVMERHGFTALALSPSGATPLGRLEPPARAAVLLGAEGPGLPADILARCAAVGIPMAGGFDSLNVATTSGIVLHHLASGGESDPGAPTRTGPHQRT